MVLGPVCFPNADSVLTKKLKSSFYFEVFDADKMTRLRYCPSMARRNNTDVMLIFVGDPSKDISIVLTD